MKRVVGSPGTWSGMALRLSQCVFAATSNLALYSGFGFSNYSAYASRSDGTKDGGSRRVDGTMILMRDDGAGRCSTIYTNGAILDSGASAHATSNFGLLSGYETLLHTGRTIRRASGHPLPICGSGSIRTDRFALNDVLFVPGLEKNVVSVSKLAELDYGVDFGKTGCFITDDRTGAIVGEGNLVAGLYQLDYLKIPLDRVDALDTGAHQ